MSYQATIRSERFAFTDLRELLGRASEEKSGDQLADVAAHSHRQRAAAKVALADVHLSDFLAKPILCADDDAVSAALLADHDAGLFRSYASLTVGELRETILGDGLTPEQLAKLGKALLPEMAAAVAMLMSTKDLVYAASRLRVITRCRNTMGQAGVLGARIQPNHPTDDVGAILLAAVEGLVLGSGDAVIGVNPATESVETVGSILATLDRLLTTASIPTQACCLAHITTQLAAMEKGAPVDLLFQSIAGTEAANKSYGIDLSLLAEGRERVLEHHRRRGGFLPDHQVMYFETGQGSALSAEAHHGIDQLTCEARAHGVARLFNPFLVNSVVGFIGPEYLANERQITRAGLEDHFVGKLLGLPMGVDVCYTNHADADQNSAENLLLLLTTAGCNYFMGVPCSDDVMLNYQSTSHHDIATARRLFGLQPAPEFAAWLEGRGLGLGLTTPGNQALGMAMRGLLEATGI
jgi:ethanolamine ammonia-lyase large subunit